MNPDRAETAALNNAQWCAAVWRAHGLPVEQAAGLWFCQGRTPRFYPNAVTVERAGDRNDQAALIGELCRDHDPDFSVKDSFATLDLRAARLTPLFETCWLWREPTPGAGAAAAEGWRVIVEAGDLAAWESAWGGGDHAGPDIFLPELLSDPHVAVLGAFDPAGAIRAGAIVYAAVGVSGVTNIFGPRDEVVQAVAALFPRHPMVGYETGQAEMAAVADGFEAVGPLRVWAHGS